MNENIHLACPDTSYRVRGYGSTSGAGGVRGPTSGFERRRRRRRRRRWRTRLASPVERLLTAAAAAEGGDVRAPRSIWPRSRGTNYGGPPILQRRDRPRVNIPLRPPACRSPEAPPTPASRAIWSRRVGPRACARLIVW